MTIRDRIRAWLGIAPLPTPAAPSPMRISDIALAESAMTGVGALNPWVLPQHVVPGVEPSKLAMDTMAPGVQSIYAWAANGAFSEGLGFLGYSYLAELSQRPEYRRMSEIIASECTRRWITLTGNDREHIKLIEAEMTRLRVREVFREVIEHDGLFGRGQVYIDTGHSENSVELTKPLIVDAAKIGKNRLKGFKAIEPIWSYPGGYDTTNPLLQNYYVPKYWLVMGKQVDSSRLLTIVGREMPDILKPAYAFGGLSLSQMAKPYIDNWLRTRQSVSDLVHSFSTMVLKTNMAQALSGAVGSAVQLFNRIKLFNQTRDNRGLMVLDKDSEEMDNVSTPLGTLDHLLAQSLEQLSSVCGIPLIVLLGQTPSGLNASSDGEMRSFYGFIKAYQEKTLRSAVHTVLDLIQLSAFGRIDETVHFEFTDLWEVSEVDAALIRKSDSEVDCNYTNAGIVSQEEVRERLNKDEHCAYYGIDLSGEPPEMDDGEADGVVGETVRAKPQTGR